ncbi:unnamed protein product, partial [Clonostachys byssicola]
NDLTAGGQTARYESQPQNANHHTLRSFYMPTIPKAMPSRTNLSKMTGCKACGLNYTGAAKVCQCVKRDSQNFHQAGGQQYGTSLGQSAPKRLKVAPDEHGKAPGEQGIP